MSSKVDKKKVTLVDCANPINKYRNIEVAQKTLEAITAKYNVMALLLEQYKKSINQPYPDLLKTDKELITEKFGDWIRKRHPEESIIKPNSNSKQSISLMDLFSKKSPQLVEIGYHAVGKYGDKDEGGLWQKITKELQIKEHENEYFDSYIDNYISRMVECVCCERKDYKPDTAAGFVFLILLSTQKSVRNLIHITLENDQDKTFFNDYYINYLKQVIDDILSSDFHELNTENILQIMMCKLRFVWLSKHTGEIKMAHAYWDKQTKENSRIIERSHNEKIQDKRERQAKCQKRKRLIEKQRNSGIEKWWIVKESQLIKKK